MLSKYLSFCCCLFLLAQCKTTSRNEYFLTANEYAKEGLLREAIDSYNKALRIEPKSPLIHRNLGLILLKAGNYKASAEHLKTAFPFFKDNFDTAFSLGEAYRGSDQYAKASYYYLLALDLKKNDLNSLQSLAWCYANTLDYAEAIKTIKKAYKLNHDSESALIETHVLIKIEQFSEAKTLIESSLPSADSSLVPFFKALQAEVAFSQNDYDQAFQLYKEALTAKPFLYNALLGLGKYYLKFSHPADAITNLEQAVRVKPKNVEPYLLLGKAYEKTDQKKSIKYYKYFLSIAASNPEYLHELSSLRKKIASLSD